MKINPDTRFAPGAHRARRIQLPPRVFFFVIFSLCGLFLTARSTRGATARPPNVLFIICDDLNDAIGGLGGHPQSHTPHIEGLWRRGLRFTNAHTNFPICGPARASLWSGLYPHTTGNYSFRHWQKYPIIADSKILMQHFRASGYGIYGTGKIFHNGHEPLELYDEYKVPADFGPFPFDGRHRREHPSLAFLLDAYPGIPHRWEHTFGPLTDVPRYAADPAARRPGFEGWQLFKKPFRYVSDDDRDRMPDELSADWAAEVLTRTHEKPFFLAVGFARPHTPLYAPKKYFDRFPLETLRLPAHLKDDVEDCAPSLVGQPSDARVQRRGYGVARYRMIVDGGGEQMWKRWVQAYLACVSFVDDQVGKVLDALDKSAYRDNTIVVFTSDHGYHMGEKNLIFKDSLWEESTRVPLAIVVPKTTRAGTECAQPVSLIDIYPTLNDLCGLPKQPNASGNGRRLDGFSMKPLLEDPEAKWEGPPVALTTIGTVLDPEKKRWVYHDSVRSRNWRYTLCANGEEELYDHRTDPHEWRNLADDPRHAAKKKRLRAELVSLRGHGATAKAETETDGGPFTLPPRSPSPR